MARRGGEQWGGGVKGFQIRARLRALVGWCRFVRHKEAVRLMLPTPHCHRLDSCTRPLPNWNALLPRPRRGPVATDVRLTLRTCTCFRFPRGHLPGYRTCLLPSTVYRLPSPVSPYMDLPMLQIMLTYIKSLIYGKAAHPPPSPQFANPSSGLTRTSHNTRSGNTAHAGRLERIIGRDADGAACIAQISILAHQQIMPEADQGVAWSSATLLATCCLAPSCRSVAEKNSTPRQAANRRGRTLCGNC